MYLHLDNIDQILIQGIPDPKKTQLDKTIDVGPNTKLDLGTLPNRFDTSTGTAQPKVVFPAPDRGFANLRSTPFTEVGSTRPAVKSADTLDWTRVVEFSGPRTGRIKTSLEATNRKIAADVVAAHK